MKRKLSCIVLALVLVLSLLPAGAITAEAASNLSHSENVVNLIKQFEGFSATAYWDVNQWTIGYGTTGYAGQTMTEAQADLALRERLDAIDQALNLFTGANNLYLTQYQHDALVSFSFNCGTEWTTQGGRFYDAVTKQAGVNEFLFAISLWANVGSTPDANLLNRRLAEANLYLNGVYSKSAPAAYTYVILDANGGTPGSNAEDKMQAYLSGSNVNILASNPTKSGYSFGGWYTAPTGGTGVKYLNASTAGRTLYAQYGIAVSVNVSLAAVRSGAGTNYTQVGTVAAGTQLVIVEIVQVNGVAWGRFIDGWIELASTSYSGTTLPSNPGSSATATNGTVVCSTGVNVRSGAGTNYPVVGSAYNGQRVTVYETVSVNGAFWGRIGEGRWISLTYVRLDSSTTPTTPTTPTNPSSYVIGTVTASGLNIRAAAGTGSAIVGSLKKGEQVKVYSQTTVGNAPWGQIDRGWICLNYVQLTAPTTPSTPGTPGTAIATGTVKSNTNLTVRSGAGTNYPRVGSLAGGTAVSIYERVFVGGMEWGRIGSGMWVCLAYVNLNTSTGGSTGGSTATTGTGTVISSTNLNVRSGAGAGYTRVGVLTPGSTVTIYEVVSVGAQQWGRIGTNMWVCMSYIRMNSTTGGTTVPSTGYTGRVISSTSLNVRAAAGTGSAIVGRLTPGTTVTVYELTSVNGVSWGRISSGWVCMQYIQITGSTGTGTGSGSVVWQ